MESHSARANPTTNESGQAHAFVSAAEISLAALEPSLMYGAVFAVLQFCSIQSLASTALSHRVQPDSPLAMTMSRFSRTLLSQILATSTTQTTARS
jgi:hypothetical protein